MRYRRRDPRALAAVAGAVLALAAAGHGHHHGRPAAASPPAAAGANEALANHMAAAYGWTGDQVRCLDALWTRESAGTWSPTVWNYQGSGAYGIPQALPADKMASAGPDWRTNPATQIRWGLGYITTTYHTPCGAWAHEQAHSWY